MSVYQDIPAKGVFRIFCSHQQCGPLTSKISHIPRPLGLGEPAGLRDSDWNLAAAIVFRGGSLCFQLSAARPDDTF
jgi:hypothetical protein